MNVVLASTSPWRANLLRQLRIPFTQVDPGYEETVLPGETPKVLCERLAEGKARAAASGLRPPFLVIASDQVASLEGTILGKPGNFDNALAQLQRCRGRWLDFHTSICLMSDAGYLSVRSETFGVRFRDLSDLSLTRYLNIEQPFACAGSIMLESLGIALIDDTRGRDLNTAIGLPLMLLGEMLAEAGIDLLNQINQAL